MNTEDDAPQLLPWWQNPVNLVAMAVAIAVVAAGLGWLVGNNRAIPDPNATDVGFLQDMQIHHEQAQQMSAIYLDKADADPNLRVVARGILYGQGIEIGKMLQLLYSFGAPEGTDTELTMVWMGEPTPMEQMRGMASGSELDALIAAAGSDADRLFAELMIAHHEGGIHMAEYAAENADVEAVRALAAQMVDAQRDEIDEINGLIST
jgi:uncharacterized protein (DUF305 family)